MSAPPIQTAEGYLRDYLSRLYNAEVETDAEGVAMPIRPTRVQPVEEEETGNEDDEDVVEAATTLLKLKFVD